jgi:hypothetical protein
MRSDVRDAAVLAMLAALPQLQQQDHSFLQLMREVRVRAGGGGGGGATLTRLSLSFFLSFFLSCLSLSFSFFVSLPL